MIMRTYSEKIKLTSTWSCYIRWRNSLRAPKAGSMSRLIMGIGLSGLGLATEECESAVADSISRRLVVSKGQDSERRRQSWASDRSRWCQDDPDALADTSQLNSKIKVKREMSLEYSYFERFRSVHNSWSIVVDTLPQDSRNLDKPFRGWRLSKKLDL